MNALPQPLPHWAIPPRFRHCRTAVARGRAQRRRHSGYRRDFAARDLAASQGFARAGVVRQRIDAQRRLYSVRPEAVQEITRVTMSHREFWQASLARAGKRL